MASFGSGSCSGLGPGSEDAFWSFLQHCSRNLDLTVKEYLEIEQVAGVAAFAPRGWSSRGNLLAAAFSSLDLGLPSFFGASTACAAFVNNVSDEIAQQMAEQPAFIDESLC